MPTDYVAALDQLRNDVGKRGARSKKVYAQWKRLFDTYKGGLPLGLWVASAQGESDGRMDAPGDDSLGEVGVHQVAASTETKFGVPSNYRAQAEGNFWLSGAELNTEHTRAALRYPSISLGSRDGWLVARLVFSIGRGGTYRILDAMGRRFGGSYASIQKYIRDTRLKGLSGFGSQSIDKVIYRVEKMPILWEIGKAAGLSMHGWRPYIPIRPGDLVAWKVPDDLQGKIGVTRPVMPPTGTAFALGAIGVGALLLKG